METRAVLRHAPISPQKVRLIAAQIRGLSVQEAEQVLAFTAKKAARLVKKVLMSAISNAESNQGADIDELRISAVFVDQGITFKRFHARARGRGSRILKRTSHITVQVSDGNN